MKTTNTLLTIKVIQEEAAVDAPFVAYVPEFDISSCGKTQNEAIIHVKEALAITLEEAKRDGTLSQVLAEAGFGREGKLSEQRSRIVVEPFAF